MYEARAFVTSRIAVIAADQRARDELTAGLEEAGFVISSAHAHATDAWAVDADIVVVLAADDVVDDVTHLQANIGSATRILVTIGDALIDRAPDLAALSVDGLVVGSGGVETIAAARAISAGQRLVSPEAAAVVLDEIARLRARDDERNRELEDLVRRLQDLSVDDGLTGLKKHGYFFERLEDELSRALRHRRPLAVALCEIDDLDGITETRGRRITDRVVQEVARVVEGALRTGDVVARLSGEAFALLLPETDAASALLVADRVREQVASLVIPEAGKATLSVGVAAAPENAVDRDSLVEAAERALYLAKGQGANAARTAGDGTVVGTGLMSSGMRGGRDRVVDLLVRVLKMRDPALADHAKRTADIAVALGAQAGLSTQRLDHLRVAALLQDVGKIGVPDRILHKRGPLTPEEWDVIKDHPKKGFELIGGLIHPEAAEAVLNNHERFDGLGYPRGLAGQEIPLLARILLVADAYIAMTMDRTFQAPMHPADALAELRRHAGSQFDPEVVATMMDLAGATDLTAIGVGGGLRYAAEPRSD